jgi:predicted enzyme related to lactoylglutathione lyase
LKLLVLKSGQLDRLREFYGHLGLAFTEERHGAGPPHYSAQIGELVLELYPLPEGISLPDTTTRLGFAVSDLEAVLESLQRAGAVVSSPARQTEWGYRAIVRDSDGRAVELYQD